MNPWMTVERMSEAMRDITNYDVFARRLRDVSTYQLQLFYLVYSTSLY